MCVCGGGVNFFSKDLLSYQRLSKNLKNLDISSIAIERDKEFFECV